MRQLFSLLIVCSLLFSYCPLGNSSTIDSDTPYDFVQTNLTEEGRVEYGDEVPEELNKEATLLVNLSFDLFQKVKAEPNIYIPCSEGNGINSCTFVWGNNDGQIGHVGMYRSIITENGKKKEWSCIDVVTHHATEVSKSLLVDNVVFYKEKARSCYATMPLKIRKEAETFVKVASIFFRHLVDHSDVIVTEKRNFFECSNERGKMRILIAFACELSDSGLIIQKLRIAADSQYVNSKRL